MAALTLFLALLWALSVPTISLADKPVPEPQPTVTVRAIVGFQLTPTYPPVVASGVQIFDVSPNPITLGAYDEKGNQVVGGDYVLEVYLYLGATPLSKVWLPGDIIVTPEDPWAWGVLNATGLTLPPQYPAFDPGMWVGTSPIGSEGDLYIGLALRTSRTQPLSKALGLTAPYRVRIGETAGFLYNEEGSVAVWMTMTPGGVAFFHQAHSKKPGRATPVLRVPE